MDEQRLSSGDVIQDRFRIVQRVGSGAFAAVWSGVDQSDGRAVAIKILHPELADHPYVVQRFQREMEVMAKLDHPNIARAIAAGSDARCRYLAMEFVEGVTMLDHMINLAQTGGRYSIADVRDVGRRLAGALDHAHALRVIHRDLKPNNVMVQRIEGTMVPTILDFGIAKVAAELSDQTTLGRRLGTLMYMSPEQLRGQHVEASADVFALGVILFEMLTLRRLFARDANDQPLFLADQNPPPEPNNHSNVMVRIAAEPRPRASLFRDGIGAAVDEVLLCAIDPAPRNRFGSAGELMQALLAALENRAPAPPPRAETALAPETAPDPVDLTKVAPQPLTSIDGATTAQVRKDEPRKRKWPIALLVLGLVGAATIYVETEEPETIQVEAIPPPPPLVTPTVQAREIVHEEEKIELPPPPKPVRLPPPPAKAMVEAPPPPPPARDPAVVAMLRDLEAEDAAVVARVSRRLEEEAQRLKTREDQVSIRRCASMSALRAEKRELIRCLERFERLLSDD